MARSPRTRGVRDKGARAPTVRARREQMLLRLLVRMTRTMTDEVITRMHGLGHGDLAAAHVRLLGNLDTEGTRIAALARRMGTSRQAVSQLLQEIEAGGHVERRPDPDDKRGVIVSFTARGRRRLDDAIAVMTAIEREYRTILGAARFATVKDALADLLAEIDPSGELGRD
jgi:DNA-binding MarR family transcriptional regulator